MPARSVRPSASDSGDPPLQGSYQRCIHPNKGSHQRRIHPQRGRTLGVPILMGISHQKCIDPRRDRTRGASILIGAAPGVYPSPWGAHRRCTYPYIGLPDVYPS
eukprot:9467487-Pyramimonas_sp.AAC.1